MTLVSVSVLVPLAFYVSLAAPILRRLFRPCDDEMEQGWPSGFSSEKYLPMQNLLNQEDFDFLSRQPGYDAQLLRKLRRDRLAIYRMYLFGMIRDANRLYYVGRLFLVQTREDQSSFLVTLLLLRLRFCVAVLRADLNFHLCRLGIGTLPARTLLNQLNALHSQVAPAAY